MDVSLKLHDNIMKAPFDIKTDEIFGVLDIITNKGNICRDPQSFIFVIDSSSSMNDMCRDNRSKIHHAKYTLVKMLELISLYNSENSVSIYHFNEKVYEITNIVKLTPDKCKELTEKVNAIEPNSITNIGSMLECINLKLQDISNDNITQIFMTDGCVTSGINDITQLTDMVPDTIKNVFIGYGVEHDAELLKSMSNKTLTGEYRFIDEIEYSGIVYGEILHSLFFKKYKNVSICAENCTIYNWRTNNWETDVLVTDILYDKQIDYHIKVINSNINKSSIIIKSDDKIVDTIHMNDWCKNKCDCSINAFKQKTMELMYESEQIIHKRRHQRNNISFDTMLRGSNNYNNYNNDNININTYIKTKLRAFMKRLNAYIKVNKQEDNEQLKRLQDDIYTCFQTFNANISNMFLYARQVSQGEHRLYSTGLRFMNENIEPRELPILSRQTCLPFYDIIDNTYNNHAIGTVITEEEDPFINYKNINIFNHNSNLLNTSSNISRIMRHVSAGI
jgi:hypothetical protein